jgi:selenocysteine lyase/cysteine desulfurase
MNRRAFLGGAAAVTLSLKAIPDALAAIAGHKGSPQETKDNEHFWSQIQRAFTVDRSIVNLNSGGVSPSPAVVHDAFKRHLDLSNSGPSYFMWRVLEPQRETARTRLARMFGADPEEIAITRNASEGLQVCQFGFDLKAGDEVLCTDQDYGRMITTFKQRVRREGIVLKTFPVPVPCEDNAAIAAGYERNITPNTKLILTCHVINLTGTILPVKEVAALGRARGIPVIVDGAHGFAHFPFLQKDLDCDYYATSLHKWLFAPVGCGMLYVRKAKIPALWPLMAADEKQTADIRKFEEIGTHPAANALAISEAVAFHEGLGAERKAARLTFLRDRWATRLSKLDRVKLLTSLKPGLACGVATFAVEGIEAGKLCEHLWEKRRIVATPIDHPDVKGTRVSPSVWTQREEIDLFCDAVESAVKSGLK